MKNGKICILIADDEKEIRDILRLLLTGEGYAVCTAENGKEALVLASAEVDLYLLDVNMPELSGFMAGSEIRKQFNAPIIFLTAYSGESDKVMGFSAGADDYIVKPFEVLELLVRMEKVLERTGKMKPELCYGDLVVDLNMHRVWEGGAEVDLKPMEFGLLTVFLKNRNVVLGRDRLLDLVWGSDFYGETRTVDVHVAKLRKKLKSAGAIKTIPKAGYMFEDDGL